MKTRTSLVGANSRAMLDPVTSINVDLAVIIHPGHPENNDSLRFDKPIQNAMLCIPVVFRNKRPKAFHHFGNSLHIFGLTRISLCYGSAELLKTFILHYCHL